ncbi:hypothetical protein ACOSQ3_005004 [Xanthoceras sorbifolium]
MLSPTSGSTSFNPVKKKQRMIDVVKQYLDISISLLAGASPISDLKSLLDELHLKKEFASSARKLRDFKESNSTIRRENDYLKLSEAKAKEAELESLTKLEELKLRVAELEAAETRLRVVHKAEYILPSTSMAWQSFLSKCGI